MTTTTSSPYGKTGKGGVPPEPHPVPQPSPGHIAWEDRLAAEHAVHGAWRLALPTL